MKHIISILAAALLIVVASAGITWFLWDTRTTWPAFPSDVQRGQTPTAEQLASAKDPTPEVAVLVDRDFAYRIGDKIPVTIFIKEKPGTEVDLHSMAIQGDFEIASEPVFLIKQAQDGGRRIRISVSLQSFNAVPKWGFDANMSYRLIATNNDVTVSLPALVLYTSNTWDQRDIIKEGKLPFNHGIEPYATGGLVLGGLLGAIFFFCLARRYGREQPVEFELKGLPNRFQLARRDFNAVWAAMSVGDRSADRYAEVSAIIRRLYKVETKTTLEAGYYLLYSYNGPIQILDILKSCDRVIYHHETLTDEEHEAIKTTFDKLVSPYPQALLDKLPPTKVVIKSAEKESTWL